MQIKNLVMCLALLTGISNLSKAAETIESAHTGLSVIVDDIIENHCRRCGVVVHNNGSGLPDFLKLSCFCDDHKKGRYIFRSLKLYPSQTTPQKLEFLDPILDPLQKLIEKISPRCYGNKATAIHRQGKTGLLGLEEEDYWDLACDRE